MKARFVLTALVIAGLTSCVVHRTVVVEQGPPGSAPVPAPVAVDGAPAPAPAVEPAPAPATGPGEPMAYDEFYNQLSPYGQWVQYPPYNYVWVPNEGPNFMPYSTGGHWIYTDAGWTWASDYSWGWAPFHYGRWQYTGAYGWYWIPGSNWGPAWVTWSSCNGNYGWAPLAYGDYGNVDFHNAYYSNPNVWQYVPQQYMGNANLENYYAPRQYYNSYIGNATPINNYYHGSGNNGQANYYGNQNNQGQANYYGNRNNQGQGNYYGNQNNQGQPNYNGGNNNGGNSEYYNSGPPASEVEKATGHQVVTYTLADNATPGKSNISGNTFAVYKPKITPINKNEAPMHKPANFIPKTELTPVTQRSNANNTNPPQPYHAPGENMGQRPAENNGAQQQPHVIISQPQQPRPAQQPQEQPHVIISQPQQPQPQPRPAEQPQQQQYRQQPQQPQQPQPRPSVQPQQPQYRQQPQQPQPRPAVQPQQQYRPQPQQPRQPQFRQQPIQPRQPFQPNNQKPAPKNNKAPQPKQPNKKQPNTRPVQGEHNVYNGNSNGK